MTALLAWLVLAQAPVTSTFDDGAILGRVCDDRNRNGQCEADEPGLAGVRVTLETGLVSVTDSLGRFHLAQVEARAPSVSQGGRLLPGRHRIGVDTRWLAAGTQVIPAAATVEVPMGAVAMQDFAVAQPEVHGPSVRLGDEAPRLSGGARTVRWSTRLTALEGLAVYFRGRRLDTDRLEVEIEPGHHELPISAVRDGLVELLALPIDVVSRASSVLVIPRALKTLGRISLDPQGSLLADVDSETSLQVGTRLASPGLVLSTTGSTVLVTATHPRAGTWSQLVERPRPQGAFALGLLDLEGSFDPVRGQFHVAGRGAALGRAHLLGFDLAAEVDLRDADVEQLIAGRPGSLVQARTPGVFERQLDLLQVPPTFGDASATVASNPASGRFRAEISREGWGGVGFGSTRLLFADSEVGRAARALEGGFVALRTPTENWGLELKGVAAPAQSDVVTGLSHRPAHERFEATGGSLFFLSHQQLVQGSEVLRVEWRDSITGLALADLHLARLTDYSIDATSGRVLLTKPLSFLASPSLLLSDPLTAGVTAVLVVDYEYLTTDVTSQVFGGELKARAGPVKLGVGALKDGAYNLLRARAEAALGPLNLSAELARSSGVVDGLAWSRDGGLSFAAPLATSLAAEGWAATVRARSVGLFGKGFWDVSGRFRDSGFEDIAAFGRMRQVSLRGEQPLGPVVITALADLRDVPDPRDPFSTARLTGRLVGGGVGYEREGWGVRLEARDLSQIFTSVAGLDGPERGGFSLGLTGRYRLTPWLQLRAGYRQQLLEHGSTGFNDTFASLGADVSLTDWLTVGLRGGWGPTTGALAWGTVSATRGNETWYGAQSLDVDSPGLGTGERRLVTGARQQVDSATSVFVEDVSATDVNGLRLARAVGLSQRVGEALTITGRYERGAKSSDGVTPDVARDAGGVTAAYESNRARLFARGEVRLEQGGLAQYLATGGGEVAILESLSASARVQFSHTSTAGQLFARRLDAVAGLAWRGTSAAVIGRYTFRRDWLAKVEQVQHLVSLLPTVRFGDRFSLAAGGHVALTPTSVLVSVSLRPSVRIIAGVEVAVEGALRTAAPDAGSLAALRGEVGYRFDQRFFVGAGYSFLGFSGTGIEAGATGANNRIYLRTEVAY